MLQYNIEITLVASIPKSVMRLSGESGALFCLHLRSDLFCSVQIPFFEHIDKEKEQGK